MASSPKALLKQQCFAHAPHYSRQNENLARLIGSSSTTSLSGFLSLSLMKEELAAVSNRHDDCFNREQYFFLPLKATAVDSGLPCMMMSFLYRLSGSSQAEDWPPKYL